MKKKNLILALASGLCILNLYSFAQDDSSGIYKTAEDFQQRKLSYAINCKTEKHKIRLNDFFNKPYLLVKHNDSTIKLYKKDIFGYRFCTGDTYRAKGKKEYQVLNYEEAVIIIYRKNVTKPPRGKTNVTNYYFSRDAFSPIQKLTIKNLKEAFPDKRRFHEQIDAKFKYNTELASFDKIHNMYSINWIYQTTKTD